MSAGAPVCNLGLFQFGDRGRECLLSTRERDDRVKANQILRVPVKTARCNDERDSIEPLHVFLDQNADAWIPRIGKRCLPAFELHECPSHEETEGVLEVADRRLRAAEMHRHHVEAEHGAFQTAFVDVRLSHP